MKAIAYNIKAEEKECLILANHKKHDITIIANSLCSETIAFAHGKEVLIVFNEDPLDENLIKGLKDMGIKYIANSTSKINHIAIQALAENELKLANVPYDNQSLSIMSRMKQVILNLDNWAAGVCLGEACCNPIHCENQEQAITKLC